MIHYQKVKNTTFNKFFRCILYLGFNCKKSESAKNVSEINFCKMEQKWRDNF